MLNKKALISTILLTVVNVAWSEEIFTEKLSSSYDQNTRYQNKTKSINSRNNITPNPNFLKGSFFEVIGQELKIDPLLLYCVTIVESGSTYAGMLSPTPLVIRFDSKAEYFDSKEMAVSRLNEILRSSDNVDIGLIQRNLHWHPTQNPAVMFDALEGIRWMAQELNETMSSTPDLALGIGRYHIWTDEVRARSYGRRVLKIYQNLSTYNNY